MFKRKKDPAKPKTSDPTRTTHRGAIDPSEPLRHPSVNDELIGELINLTAKYERLKDYARDKNSLIETLGDANDNLVAKIESLEGDLKAVYRELQKTRAARLRLRDELGNVRTRLVDSQRLYGLLVEQYAQMSHSYLDGVADERLIARAKAFLDKEEPAQD